MSSVRPVRLINSTPDTARSRREIYPEIHLVYTSTGYGCALSHGISRNHIPPSLPLNSTPQAGGPSAARYAERQKERRRRTLTGQPGKQHAARGPICLSKPKPAMVKAEMVTHAVVKLSGQFANGAPCSCIGKLNGRIIRELPS